MHRIDLARATGKTLDLDPATTAASSPTSSPNGRAPTASLHPLLDGPAGGEYRSGTGGEHVDMDAIEFGRILSGRGQGTGILRHPCPLARPPHPGPGR